MGDEYIRKTVIYVGEARLRSDSCGGSICRMEEKKCRAVIFVGQTVRAFWRRERCTFHLSRKPPEQAV